MKQFKKKCSAFVAHINELARNNPILFGTMMTSVTAIIISVILIGTGILRDLGFLLIMAVAVIALLPDHIKDFLLGLIYGKKTSQEEYPVFIGWNGTRFVPESIQESFKRLSDCFESWYYTKVAVTEDLIQYQFKVYGVTDSDSAESLVQAIAEKALRHQFSIFMMYHPDYSALAHVRLNDQYLSITFSRNEHGVKQIQHIKEQQRQQQYEIEHPAAVASVLTESWDDSPVSDSSKGIPYGYSLSHFEDYNVRIPILIPLNSHPHALIVGSSGSGKSKALIYLLGKILQSEPEIDLWVCDFKASDDFAFLKDYPQYFAGDNCYKGLKAYYEVFSQARQLGSDTRRHLLIYDEYPASVLYYQGKDKQEKTKKSAELLSIVSEILMLGRGVCCGFGIFTVCQRASADVFPQGSRDNYMISLSLGRTSKEQKGMLFPGEEIPDRVYSPGEGILLADGRPLQTVKFPLVEDAKDWERHIKAILAPN